MSATPEAAIKKQITAYLTDQGIWWDMPVRMGYGRRGVPDILCCFQGRFLAFEVKAVKAVKAEGKEASPWQTREIAAIRASGGTASVVFSVDDVKYILGK